MKTKVLTITSLLLSFFCSMELHAQETLSTGGGDAEGIGGSVSYTIGQLVCQTNTGFKNQEAQGIQQAYEFSILNKNEELRTNIKASVYPNPASDYINLEIETTSEQNGESMQYYLCDLKGSLIESRMLSSNRIRISMEHLKPSIYLIKIVKGIKIIKVFKIVKH